MAPPLIHLGRALIDRVVTAGTNPKEKEGLKEMWIIVRQTRDSLNASTTTVDDPVDIIGPSKCYNARQGLRQISVC